MSEVLVKTFDSLAQAPGGVMRLRELILSLAVRGKLVPQDPGDEPASVLVQRIRVERERLAARGKIKREKSTLFISDEDKPFEIPNGWEWARLGAIGHVFNGNSINASEKEEKYAQPNGLPYISTKDVGYGFEPLNYESGFHIPLDNKSFRIAHQGAVLICAEGGSAGKKCGLTNRDVCFGNKLFATELFGGISSRFVLSIYLSPVFREYFREAMTGIIGGVSIAKFVEIPIQLPPLGEQSRIVARVDELMRLCDALEAKGRLEAQQHARLLETLLGTLTDSTTPEELAANWQRVAEHFDLLLDRPEAVDVLEQTMLQLAVRGKLVEQDPTEEPAEDLLLAIQNKRDAAVGLGSRRRGRSVEPIDTANAPFDLPFGWTWARFHDLGEFGRGKSRHRPRNDPILFNPPVYPLVQTGEVARAKGIIREYHSRYSDVGLSQSRLWPAGTLCITIAANIADSAILGFDACFPDSVVGFIPDDHLGGAEYFLAFLATARERLIDFAPATAQKNINLEILESLLIPLPPVQEMRRIVARVTELRQFCADLRDRLAISQTAQSRLAEALVESALS